MNNKLIGIAAVVVSATAGAVGGYLFAEARLKKIYAEITNDEIAEMRKHYSAMYKQDEFSDPETILARRTPQTPKGPDGEDLDNETYDGDKNVAEEALERIVDGLKYGRPNTRNKINRGKHVVTEGPAVGEYEISHEDIATRSIDRPYVLGFEEFMESDQGYTQATWTYYEGDKTLANDADEIVDDVEGLVGEANLSRFGYGSRDPKIVYVRNERISMDFEICHSAGLYSEEVAGLAIGKQHKNTPRKRTR